MRCAVHHSFSEDLIGPFREAITTEVDGRSAIVHGGHASGVSGDLLEHDDW